MDWWKQLELLRMNLAQLGFRRLIALSLAAAGVLGAIGAIAFYASRPETDALYTGLGQADIARIGLVLNEAGVPFDVSSDGTKVFVRRAQTSRARMLLAERGLPAGSTSGYELFDKLGPMGLTSFMQDVTRNRALEGELARTIQTMKGVVSARVHIVAPPSGSFRRERQPASASVVVRMNELRPQMTAQVIRHLVSAAVPGLPPEQVSVMSADGSMLIMGGDGATLGSARKIEIEQALSRQAQDNIRRTLAPYLGVEHFEVSAAVQISLDKRQVNEQVWDPDSKSERSTKVVKEQGSALNANARQAVTVEQNVPTEQGAATGGEQSRKNNERREEVTNFELSSKSLSTVSEGHRVESLQVSVVVNRKRLEAAGASVDDRLKQIEGIAASAAGLDVKRGDKISVAAVEFKDGGPDAAAAMSSLERLALHLDTVIMSVTAIAALLILVWLGLLPSIRTIMGKPPGGLETARLESDSAPGLSGPEGQAVAAVNDPASVALVAPRGNPIQQKLAQLIERDEKHVAEIMKQWLAKG